MCDKCKRLGILMEGGGEWARRTIRTSIRIACVPTEIHSTQLKKKTTNQSTILFWDEKLRGGIGIERINEKNNNLGLNNPNQI
jgi:hypothetical protein